MNICRSARRAKAVLEVLAVLVGSAVKAAKVVKAGPAADRDLSVPRWNSNPGYPITLRIYSKDAFIPGMGSFSSASYSNATA